MLVLVWFVGLGIGDWGCGRVWDDTGWAVVVAGQDRTLVIAETLPVVVCAVADSSACGGEAVCDDAVGIVRCMISAIGRGIE